MQYDARRPRVPMQMHPVIFAVAVLTPVRLVLEIVLCCQRFWTSKSMIRHKDTELKEMTPGREQVRLMES
jgi:hypothetical protein